MLVVLRRFQILIASLVTLLLFVGGVLLVGPSRMALSGEFDDLLGEAILQGTKVDAARSRKDAAESSVRKAWSKFLPSINATGEFGHSRNNALGRLRGGRTNYDSSEYGVSATLPIYRGGENYYGLKEAKANATAENHSFKEVKQLLLLETSRVIFGIIRDREIVKLQRQNQQIVGTILKTTQSRYEGGEATRTDIAIAEDQYTSAQSVYTQAIDNLRANETEFFRLIGRQPGRLSLPKGLTQKLPRNLNQAIALAQEQNPQLLAAMFRSKAAEHSVKASYGGFLPKVDLNMDYTEERYHGENLPDDSDLTVKLNFTVPLFQPEALASTQVSKHVSQQRKHEARDARLTAKAMATIAWRSYHTAKKRYQLGLVRIKAARAAARGMRRELDAGQRTVLDVLDTQERLVQARVGASESKYEKYMAAHLLLSAVGELDVATGTVEGFGDYVRLAEKRKHSDNSQWRESRLNKTVIKKANTTKYALGKKQQKTKLTALKSETSSRSLEVGEEGWTAYSQTSRQPYTHGSHMKITSLPLMKERPVVLSKAEIAERVAAAKVAEKSGADMGAAIDGVSKSKLVKTVVKQTNAASKVTNKGEGNKIAGDIKAGTIKTGKIDRKALLATMIMPDEGLDEAPSKEVDVAAVPETNKTTELSDKKDIMTASLALPLKKPAPLAKKQTAVAETTVIKTKVQADDIVTGSVAEKDVRRSLVSGDHFAKAVRAGGDEKSRRAEIIISKPQTVALNYEIRPFSVHKIPLPVRKITQVARRQVQERQALVTGSLKRRSDYAEKRRTANVKKHYKRKAAALNKKNVYPATMRNKFAVWWNDKIDKVIGSDGRAKPKLVSLNEYRQMVAK